jgi:hypothetical protein
MFLVPQQVQDELPWFRDASPVSSKAGCEIGKVLVMSIHD